MINPPLRPGLPPVPARITRLPRDHRGYPIPYFVAWIKGRPDFRVIEPAKYIRCINHNRCWICGDNLGAHLAFTIGPMCAINRISSEPPSHRECAEFAAQACPFLLNPAAQRRDANLPDEHKEAPGIPVTRNPVVTLIWITKTYHQIQAPNGTLIQIGDPTETLWYYQGRPARYEEAIEPFESGLRILSDMADQQGGAAPAQLAKMTQVARRYLPEKTHG